MNCCRPKEGKDDLQVELMTETGFPWPLRRGLEMFGVPTCPPVPRKGADSIQTNRLQGKKFYHISRAQITSDAVKYDLLAFGIQKDRKPQCNKVILRQKSLAGCKLNRLVDGSNVFLVTLLCCWNDPAVSREAVMLTCDQIVRF